MKRVNKIMLHRHSFCSIMDIIDGYIQDVKTPLDFFPCVATRKVIYKDLKVFSPNENVFFSLHKSAFFSENPQPEIIIKVIQQCFAEELLFRKRHAMFKANQGEFDILIEGNSYYSDFDNPPAFLYPRFSKIIHTRQLICSDKKIMKSKKLIPKLCFEGLIIKFMQAIVGKPNYAKYLHSFENSFFRCYQLYKQTNEGNEDGNFFAMALEKMKTMKLGQNK